MHERSRIPESRRRLLNDAPVQEEGDFVLYWMTAARRTTWNFGLDRAVEWARTLHRPLVVLEALRCGYPWASDRLHRFVLEGMRDNAKRLDGKNVIYHPWVERKAGEGRGLLAALAEHACVVVTDDYPCFFLPRMVEAAGRRLPVRLEAVDSNGLFPMRATDRVFTTAFSFRAFLQKELPNHLATAPRSRPAFHNLAAPRKLPAAITRRWPRADLDVDLATLPIDHDVAPVATRGGSGAAGRAWKRFLEDRLLRYAEDRNRPDAEGASGLSPYLHFGHISAHRVFDDLSAAESWLPDRLSSNTKGRREGWWGMSPPAEAFLDQLVTWRELGFNMCALAPDEYDKFKSLPDWARQTLREHAEDPREHVYSLAKFEAAGTHDELWNAAQRQLVREGRIHNYLRMLWGKKILEWSRTPRKALAVMLELNNKYALDGRDPNSYSGIFWTLGRYDRPWGPERPVFGKVRYMSSANTARKLRVQGYLETYAAC